MEIKFRAWLNGRMVYQTGALSKMSRFWQVVEYDKEAVVMQFTGLHDKNGKEIYEGDIVQMHSEFYNAFEAFENDDNNFDRDYIGEIVIQASRGTVLKRPKWHCNITDEDGRDNFYKPITARRSEVIGNIYEKSELLSTNL